MGRLTTSVTSAMSRAAHGSAKLTKGPGKHCHPFGTAEQRNKDSKEQWDKEHPDFFVKPKKKARKKPSVKAS